MNEIPLISAQSLIDSNSPQADAAMLDGAARHGFLLLTDLPASIPIDPNASESSEASEEAQE